MQDNRLAIDFSAAGPTLQHPQYFCKQGGNVVIAEAIDAWVRYIPFWLNLLAFLTEVTQQAVIKSVEEVASELGHAREDVPGTGTVLASLQPGSKLTCTCTFLSGLAL